MYTVKNNEFASLVRNLANATEILARITEQQGETASAPVVPPTAVTKGIAKTASKPVAVKAQPTATKTVNVAKAAPVKPAPAASLPKAGEFTATVDGDGRVRFPAERFSLQGQCIVNGALFYAGRDGRGRLTAKSFGLDTAKGDVVVFKGRKGKSFDYVAELLETSPQRPNVRKSAPVPAVSKAAPAKPAKLVVPVNASKPTAKRGPVPVPVPTKAAPKRVNAQASVSTKTAQRSNHEAKKPSNVLKTPATAAVVDTFDAIYRDYAALASKRYNQRNFLGNATYLENDIRFYLTVEQRKEMSTRLVKCNGSWIVREDFTAHCAEAFRVWIEELN